MKFSSISEIAKKWGVSERSVRDYCAKGRVIGAYLEGKTWRIPEEAKKPMRQTRHPHKLPSLLDVLQREKEAGIKGGIYHRLQVDMTYNSNHMEGSKLSHDETRFIYETKTVGAANDALRIDDIMETVNHFRCIDLVIDSAKRKLNEPFIKQLHLLLKTNTEDSRKPWFRVGEYKVLPNTVGERETTPPEEVKEAMRSLLTDYNKKQDHSFEEIVEFHAKFEEIHPFQDGNGRVGRLIALKECLHNDIVPFLILDEKKMFYYRGLANWKKDHAWLLETCLDGQDLFKRYLDTYRIAYK